MKIFEKLFVYIFIFLILTLLVISHFTSPKNIVPQNFFGISKEKLLAKKGSLPNGNTFQYWEHEEAPAKKQYIYYNSALAPEIVGFSGPIEIAVMLDTSGNVINFDILNYNETPAFIEKALKEKEKYLQRNIFSPFDENLVFAVTGATYTSSGISRALWISGNRFASLVLGKKIQSAEAGMLRCGTSAKGKVLFFTFIIWTIAVFILRFRISRNIRFAALALAFVFWGLYFKIQYSPENIISLLFFEIPSHIFSIPFIIILLVPLLALIFGNYYCGFLCPFGALQELVNYLNFTGYNLTPDKKFWKYLRLLKYIILLALLSLFIFTGKSHSVYSGDLLSGIFSFSLKNPFLWILIAGILFVSLFSPRFWCRNLCPAGAFLSIFNKINILKFTVSRKILMKHLPISPGYCDLGISNFNESDCINCDRCRIIKNQKGREFMEQQKKSKKTKSNIIYSILTAVFFIIIILSYYYPFVKENSSSSSIPVPITTYKDGTYSGRAKGYAGDIVCNVTILNGKISLVKIISSEDDAPKNSFTVLPSEIIRKQSADVDSVTGATYSSKGLLNAVKQALAIANGTIKEKTAKEQAASLKSDNFTISPEDCKDGTYVGIGKGTRQITLSLIIKSGKIKDIKILDQQETMPGEAFEKVIQQIIEKQNLTEIILPKYARKTSQGILDAVNMAMSVAAESKKLEHDLTGIPHSRIIKTIKLPPPVKDGGTPLMLALNNRKSTRTFSTEPLSLQEVSNLLWAAFGINRPDKGRTAPSDMNMQEIRIFLAMPDGLFTYDARENSLLQLSTKDIREHTGYQLFTQQAPLNLIFAADLNAMNIIKSDNEKETAALVDTAFISQNVYLYCSSFGLNTVVLGWFDKKKLHKLMELDDNFILTYTQPVGYSLSKTKNN